MSDLDHNSVRREQLSAAKRALLERRLQGTWMDDQVPAIPRRSSQGPTALSFAQQRLWFLDRLQPASSFYNFCEAVRLTGTLDVMAIERCLSEILRRHEALRTTFPVQDGQPIQSVGPAEPFQLAIEDLRDILEAERNGAALRFVTEEARRPFNLTRDRLLRATLLKLSVRDHILVLTMHHIVSDGWSLGVLIRELATLYALFSAGKTASLPELAIQYSDFAYWQRRQFVGEVLERHLVYWKQQLRGCPPVLELATDRLRPKVQTFRGARQSVLLPGALTEALERLGQQEGASLFMTLLAAFKTLLLRYTGQRDLVVGSPIANRNLSELEPLIGFFVNMLVLRTDLSANPSFRALLRRVRRVALEAYDHQDMPFDKLVQELHPARMLTHSPLFQIVFALQNASIPPLELPNLTLQLLDFHDGTAKFELLMSIINTAHGLSVSLEYNTDLFNAARMTRMLDHFRTILEAIVNHPDECLSMLPILTDAERKQMLVDWNNNRTPATDQCLHQMVEAQVQRTPDRIAVMFGTEQLTYRDLDRRANQLAHYLQARGVGPEVLVGMAMERSIAMVVAVLGVLKAGGAFLPLDPNYPGERLELILAEARPLVLLTKEVLQGPVDLGRCVVSLDSEWDLIAQQPDSTPVSSVTGENLAYVIYTSGSTGRPKGISMRHLPISNLISWHLRIPTLPDGGRTLQFSSLNFDVAFQEMFVTWSSGGRLILVSEDQRRDLANLLRFIVDQEIERLFLPMVVLQTLAELATNRGLTPASVREIFAAGEPLLISREIEAMLGKQSCILHNHYGPSECHVVTDFSLRGPPDQWPRLPPIGRPLPNIQIYLLDSHLQPVPPGIAGEIYIGGIALSRGYLTRPDLTAEKFIPDCFGSQRGARLYKTGDLARYRDDGNIEFLGRIDHQMKIRGFRVELIEIEAVLAQHPAVRDSVVLVCADPHGDKHLIGYAVSDDDPPPTTVELRSYLKNKLPDYMVPATFVVLDAFPLDSNGKVDRRALPLPENDRPELATAYTAPQTATEQMISAIWQEVLQIDRVGTNDQFFDLGGNSLLLLQVQEKLRTLLGKDVAAVDLFEYPTIGSLAKHLDQEHHVDEPTEGDARARTRITSARTLERLRLRRQAAREQGASG